MLKSLYDLNKGLDKSCLISHFNSLLQHHSESSGEEEQGVWPGAGTRKESELRERALQSLKKKKHSYNH